MEDAQTEASLQQSLSQYGAKAKALVFSSFEELPMVSVFVNESSISNLPLFSGMVALLNNISMWLPPQVVL